MSSVCWKAPRSGIGDELLGGELADDDPHPLVNHDLARDHEWQCHQQAQMRIQVTQERGTLTESPYATPSRIDRTTSGNQANSVITMIRRVSSSSALPERWARRNSW